MPIHISGSGPNMASMLAEHCRGTKTKYLDGNAPWPTPEPNSVVIHVGSRNRFVQTLAFCEANGTPFIHGATGQDDLLPTSPGCAIVVAPNFLVPMVALIESVISAMEALGHLGMRVELKERHQASKKDKPSGTALAMARKLGIPREKIRVERFGTSPRARHELKFTIGNYADYLKITLVTNVRGRRLYAAGALMIAKAIIQRETPLENRIYSVSEVLQ